MDGEEYDLDISPNEICRTCLSQETNNLKSIFCNDIVDGNIVKFNNVYEIALDLKIDKEDGLPSKICLSCKKKIQECYAFRERCRKSVELLQKIFKAKTVISPNVEERINKEAILEELKDENNKESDNEKQKENERKEKIKELEQILEYDSEDDTSQIKQEEVEEETENIDNEDVEEVDYVSFLDETSVEEIVALDDEDSNNDKATINIKDNNTLSGSASKKEFKNIELLKQHFETHPSLKYKCILCPREFFRESTRNFHMAEVHKKKLITINDDLMGLCEISDFSSDEYDGMDVPMKKQVMSKREKSSEDIFNNFKCSLCNNDFYQEEEYLQHLKCHKTKDINSKTKSKSKLSEKHLEVHRLDTPKRFRCNLCRVLVRGHGTIDRHIFIHRSTFFDVLNSFQFYKCSTCLAIFLTGSELESHWNDYPKRQCETANISKHLTKEDTSYLDNKGENNENVFKAFQSFSVVGGNLCKCETCNEVVPKDNMNQHFYYTHNDDNAELEEEMKIHKCGNCLMSFSNAKEARQHLFLNHVKVYECPYELCGNSYETFHKLNSHLDRTHYNDTKNECLHCSQVFANNNEMIMHQRNDCEKRKHVCSYCEKKFLTAIALTIHERIHKNDKRFMCDFCGKKFTQRGDLSSHKRIHSGEKPYQCTICHKSFRTHGHKRDHMSTHVNEKNFECEICHKTFKAERILKGHLLLHGQRKFSCEVCGKLFTRRHHVKMHMKTHEKHEKLELLQMKTMYQGEKNKKESMDENDDQNESKLVVINVESTSKET